MHGVSSHMMHAAACGSIMGVPAASRNRAGAFTIAPTGQAKTHSLQRVHPERKATSSTAPGGRWIGSANRLPIPGAPGGGLPESALGRGAVRGTAAGSVGSPAATDRRKPPSKRPRRSSRRDRLESWGIARRIRVCGGGAIDHRRRRGCRRMVLVDRTPQRGRGTARSSFARGGPDASRRIRARRDN